MPFATWIPDQLRRFGVQVEEVDGWQRRGSPRFDPGGVVCHHTAAGGGEDRPSLEMCINGRNDLPGPLCNVLLTRSGVAIVVAAGRANHAGSGGFRGLAGNGSVLGIEAENDGRGEPWSGPQLEAFQRIVAGLLDGIGRDETWCLAHREWAPRRKIDPVFDMDGFRNSVGHVLRGGDTAVVDLRTASSEAPTDDGLLKRGSEGAAVRDWQELLNRAGAALTVDGDFGAATESATREFQAGAGLAADGVVGSKTRQAMNERLAPVLGRGDEGPDVAAWQELLNRAGAAVAVDGDFGPATEQATRDFQAGAGLTVDGIVGPRTRAAIVARLVPAG